MKLYTFFVIVIVTAVLSGCETGSKSGIADGVTGVHSNYAWDGFKDSQGKTIYGCRSISTREFVDNSLCTGSVNDDTWPE